MKITNRLIDNAQQKNFRVNEHFYTDRDLIRLRQTGKIDELEVAGLDNHLAVYARNCENIEVEVDYQGYFQTVVFLKECGTKIWVQL